MCGQKERPCRLQPSSQLTKEDRNLQEIVEPKKKEIVKLKFDELSSELLTNQAQNYNEKPSE